MSRQEDKGSAVDGEVDEVRASTTHLQSSTIDGEKVTEPQRGNDGAAGLLSNADDIGNVVEVREVGSTRRESAEDFDSLREPREREGSRGLRVVDDEPIFEEGVDGTHPAGIHGASTTHTDDRDLDVIRAEEAIVEDGSNADSVHRESEDGTVYPIDYDSLSGTSRAELNFRSDELALSVAATVVGNLKAERPQLWKAPLIHLEDFLDGPRVDDSTQRVGNQEALIAELVVTAPRTRLRVLVRNGLRSCKLPLRRELERAPFELVRLS